jgi:hypothetical protein
MHDEVQPPAAMREPSLRPDSGQPAKQGFVDPLSLGWDDMGTGPLTQQPNEIRSLAESIRSARVALEQTLEELTAMRQLISRNQGVLAMLDARLEMQRRQIEAIDHAQVKLSDVVAELPKTLKEEMEGSEYLVQLKTLNSFMSAERKKENILMSTVRAARSAFIKVQEELMSMQGLVSARDRAVLGLLDAQLEKMQGQLLVEKLDEMGQAQRELAGTVAQLPATIAQQIEGSENWERLRALLTTSSPSDTQAEAFMDTLKGTMSAWVTMQEEMNEIRELITTRDQTIPTKEITARIQAVEKRQSMLASAIFELPSTLRRDMQSAISELPAALKRDLDDARHTDKIVTVLTSTLAQKAQERTFLLSTVEGARSAFSKMHEALAEMQEHQATREKEVVDLIESRLGEIEKRRMDARFKDAQVLQGRFAELESRLSALRREIETAAREVSERVDQDGLEIAQLVRSVPKAILTELTDAAEASGGPPSALLEDPEEDELFGGPRETRFRLSDKNRPTPSGRSKPRASSPATNRRLSGEAGAKSNRTGSKTKPKT